MKKAYLKKFSSFEEMNKFDIKYDFSLTPEERLDITQFLREQYYKIKQIKPERMKKVIKIITEGKMYKKILTAFIVVILLGFAMGKAAFIDPGWGTRGAGKAGAYIATADDASSVMWNPAALSQIFMKEGMFSYHKPYVGLDGLDLSMGYFSLVYPYPGIANFGAAGTSFNGDGIYKESTYRFTAARELSDLINLGNMQLATGLSFKYLSHSYVWDDEIEALDDPVVNAGDSASAFTMDFGLLFQPIYKVPIGLTVKNILPADVGLYYEDIVPMEANLGAAYRAGTIGKFEEVTPEFKIGFRNIEDDRSKISYGIGIESWLAMHTFGLRLGYNNNEIATGLSFEKYFGNVGLRIDYAALFSMAVGDNLGSHRVSTSVKF
ncbi:MAG: hypothetical protein PF545_05575 [Elusimicrobia bacterium]|jgi:hypothetical protein|nr:hypothetical protein [Elusimicrobiota bacterium]